MPVLRIERARDAIGGAKLVFFIASNAALFHRRTLLLVPVLLVPVLLVPLMLESLAFAGKAINKLTAAIPMDKYFFI
jgi:ABC-type transport system involved in cytochrome c biogenesis permease component